MVKSLTSEVEVDIYDIIFKRKSIRKFDNSSLDEGVLNRISEELDNLTPLYNDIKTDIKIISGDDVKLRSMKQAPHYLAIFSENKEGYLTNLGFMLQKMDLLFSASGIGSCWQGIPSPKSHVIKSSNLKFIILMAFGMPTEPLHRADTSEFKRKSLEKITDIEDADELLEPVRLAPSAINSQPWFFTGTKDMIHACSNKPNFLKGVFVNKYIPIDVGIAIYHLLVSADHFKKTTTTIFNKDETLPKGLKYHATLKLDSIK